METIFWIFSKILWLLLAPDKVVLILLFLGTIFMWTKRQRLGRWLVSIATILFLVPTFLSLNNFLLWPLEERFPTLTELPDNISGIIVLSGSEKTLVTLNRGQPSLNGAGERLVAFVALARRYPQAQLIYAGGTGALTRQNIDKTKTARMIFEQLGLNLDRVQFDSNARNTFENAVNSFNLIGNKIEGDWVLITSAYHMPRAVGIFRKIGWNVIPYPVDYQTTGKWNNDWRLASLNKFLEFSRGVHEWLGLGIYWMTGKTSAFFPEPATAGGDIDMP